jgi:hypothetical protein
VLFPGLTIEWWRELSSYLSWSQTHGSGYAFSRRDLVEMPYAEIVWRADWANRRRELEKRKIESAR